MFWGGEVLSRKRKYDRDILAQGSSFMLVSQLFQADLSTTVCDSSHMDGSIGARGADGGSSGALQSAASARDLQRAVKGFVFRSRRFSARFGFPLGGITAVALRANPLLPEAMPQVALAPLTVADSTA